MTHIPFQHSYAKGGSACYIGVGPSGSAAVDAHGMEAAIRGPGETPSSEETPPVPSSTLSYSDASSAGSTESFPSDSSCSDNSSEIDFADSRSVSDSDKYGEVRQSWHA